MTYDYCVIGGGIVGLATARELLARRKGASLLLLEKESGLAQHQTGHNSGVIHAGVYYAPGSLKADLCKRGALATKEFCRQHDIPFEVCGKLLVATDGAEAQRLEALWERTQVNGIPVERLSAGALREREPHIAGVAALYVPSTGIVNYRQVAAKMGEELARAGASILFGMTVEGIREAAGAVEVSGGGQHFTARQLIVCAGLQSDRLAQAAGLAIEHRIVPFRGEYYRLPAARAQGLIRHLIYPVPNPALPFLGIHLTRMIDGGVTVGPNAVLGFAREGYPKFSFNARDMAESLRFAGFWKTIGAHLGSGVVEMRNSLWKRGYLAECRKYCPSLEADDLQPEPAGIRAQAVMRDGTLVHDFLFLETSRMLHVCNAPSPAATSAIPIGQMIADRCLAGKTRETQVQGTCLETQAAR